MPKLSVNGKEVEFEQGMTVLQACELAEAEVPRFCYHDRLKIAGNCRMCLVQIEGGPPKPAASCAMPANEGMVVHTNSPMVQKAREGVMEFLLINHPLDCPICDQGGECDLQDQAMSYGKGENRFDEHKRAVKDKYMGPVIKTHMTRCIHCTRCVRFMDDVAGVPELGATYRGEKMQVGTFIEKGLSSELSGNIVDLCPVGALTSKPYAFKARPWELKKTDSIDISDAVGSNIRIDARGNEVFRILPRINDDINEEWISDKTRFIFEGLKYQRLDKPYIRKGGKLQASDWSEALKSVINAFKKTAPENIASIAGDLVDCESIFLLKNILDNLGVKSYDCRQDGALYDASSRQNYILNSTISGLEEADAVLLVGSNPRYEASLVNARIRKAVVENNAKVAVIGNELDLNYGYEYLGSNSSVIEDVLSGKSNYSEVLKNAKNPVIIIGNAVYKRNDSEAILSQIAEIAEKYNATSNSLQKAIGRTGALDLGFVPQDDGKDIYSIQKAVQSGDIKFVFLVGADEFEVKNLEKSFVVYMGHHGDKGAEVADVILPSAAYTEKSATYVNLEGRPQRTAKAIFPVGEAKSDWEILNEISSKLGFQSFDDLQSLRASLAESNPIFAEENIDQIIEVQQSEKPASKKGTKVRATSIRSDEFNFYFTDPISRYSNTLRKCNEEFGEQKGFAENKKIVA